MLDLSGLERARTLTLAGYRRERPLLSGFTTERTSGFRIEGFQIGDPSEPNGCPYVTRADTGSLPATDYCNPSISSEIDSGTSDLQLVDDDITTNVSAEQQVGNDGPISNITFDHVHDHNIGYHCDIGGNPSDCSGSSMVGLWATPGDGIENLTIENSRFDHLNCSAVSMTGSNAVFIDDTFAYIESPSNTNCHAEAFQSLGVAGVTWKDNLLYNTGIGMIATCNGSGTSQECGGDWVVEDSVFLRSGAYPIKLDNTIDGAEIINNTFWDGGQNLGLYMGYTTDQPRNSISFVVENNIIDNLSVDPRLNVAVENYNLVANGRRSNRDGARDIFGRTPRFASRIGSNCGGMSFNDNACPTAGFGTNAALRPGSAGIASGTSGPGIPSTDIADKQRSKPFNMGAW